MRPASTLSPVLSAMSAVLVMVLGASADAGAPQKATKILKSGKSQALKDCKTSIKALEKQLAIDIKEIELNLKLGQSGPQQAMDLYGSLSNFQAQMLTASSTANNSIKVAVQDSFEYLAGEGITESKAPNTLRYGMPGPLKDVFAPFREARDKRYHSITKRLESLAKVFDKKAGVPLVTRIRSSAKFRENYTPPQTGAWSVGEALTIDLVVAYSQHAFSGDGVLLASGTSHKINSLTLSLYSGPVITYPVTAVTAIRWEIQLSGLVEKNYSLRIAADNIAYEHTAIFVP